MKLANETQKSAQCPVCGCAVMFQKHKSLKASLVRALALANHVKTLHNHLLNPRTGGVA